jgi:hypothetical protein
MGPSPHRCQTWRRSPHGPWEWVVPAPLITEAAAQGWRLSLPSHQAQRPMPQWRAQGG